MFNSRHIRFHSGLVEAFKGYYDLEGDEPERAAIGIIQSADHKERLRVYLEWNGILGYTESVFDIATNGGEYEK